MEEVARLTGRVKLLESTLRSARDRIRELETDATRYGLVLRQIQRVLLAIPKSHIVDLPPDE